MSKHELRAVGVDLIALQAVVRALVRTQARRSPTALCDLLQALSVEAERLRDHVEDAGPAGVLEAWIEDIKEEGMNLRPSMAS